MEYPKLRNIQIFPVSINGRQYMCLSDPQRISDKPIIIPRHFVPVLSLLDGKHSLLDIKAEYLKYSGNLLFEEELKEFLKQLDYYLFLDSIRFKDFEKTIIKKFISLEFRPAFYSGLCYPSDPRKLRDELNSFFLTLKENGLQDNKLTKKITAIIAPHRDIKTGSLCYASAYSALSNSMSLPELYIILGTCHAEIKGLFSLTKKDFYTPLGIVKTDQEFINHLQKNSNLRLLSEEILHRTEQSIEFQILFLQTINEKFGSNMPSFKICPILCGFTPYEFQNNPEIYTAYRAFIDPLKDLLSLSKKRVCFIASMDLAHIGPKFGDQNAPGHPEIKKCLQEDTNLLKIIARQDQDEFQRYIIKDFKKRRICGYPVLTALLDVLPASEGKILHLNYSSIDNLDSIVTYASMAFYETY